MQVTEHSEYQQASQRSCTGLLPQVLQIDLRHRLFRSHKTLLYRL